jgi:hypothetical protein
LEIHADPITFDEEGMIESFGSKEAFDEWCTRSVTTLHKEYIKFLEEKINSEFFDNRRAPKPEGVVKAKPNV